MNNSSYDYKGNKLSNLKELRAHKDIRISTLIDYLDSLDMGLGRVHTT